MHLVAWRPTTSRRLLVLMVPRWWLLGSTTRSTAIRLLLLLLVLGRSCPTTTHHPLQMPNAVSEPWSCDNGGTHRCTGWTRVQQIANTAHQVGANTAIKNANAYRYQGKMKEETTTRVFRIFYPQTSADCKAHRITRCLHQMVATFSSKGSHDHVTLTTVWQMQFQNRHDIDL